MTTSEWAIRIVVLGGVATLVMDGWALLLRWMGLPTLDYALVGRWLGHMRKGRWWHRPIQHSTPMPHERLLGWVAHYALSILFALLLWAVTGEGWLRQPTLAPALVFGVATVIVPWCVIQPAFGAGVAASRSPKPWRARVQSAATHAVFGVGLFIGALVVA